MFVKGHDALGHLVHRGFRPGGFAVGVGSWRLGGGGGPIAGAGFLVGFDEEVGEFGARGVADGSITAGAGNPVNRVGGLLGVISMRKRWISLSMGEGAMGPNTRGACGLVRPHRRETRHVLVGRVADGLLGCKWNLVVLPFGGFTAENAEGAEKIPCDLFFSACSAGSAVNAWRV